MMSKFGLPLAILAAVAVLFCMVYFGGGFYGKTTEDKSATAPTANITLTSAPVEVPAPDPEFEVAGAKDDWRHDRPLLVAALKRGVKVSASALRADLSNWLLGAERFTEKAEMMELYLRAVDSVGDYDAVIMPEVRRFVGLYSEEIRKAGTDDRRRAELFRQELAGVLAILASLDKDIKAGAEFDQKADEKFKVFLRDKLGHEPDENEANTKRLSYSDEFLKEYPQFNSSKRPGLDAPTRQDRSLAAYHAFERQRVEAVQKQVAKRPTLTLPEFEAFANAAFGGKAGAFDSGANLIGYSAPPEQVGGRTQSTIQ